MREDAYDIVLPSPLGRLGVHLRDEKLCAIVYLGQDTLYKPAKTMAGKRVVAALNQYFSGAPPLEALSLHLEGTEFQLRVWQALRDIPYGQTITYGGLARRLGSGARAVGGACRENPIPILVPCHRVVGKVGRGGYSGQTQGPMMARKHWLLAHEGTQDGLAIAL